MTIDSHHPGPLPAPMTTKSQGGQCHGGMKVMRHDSNGDNDDDVRQQLLNINYCCGLFTDYISARAHYSRLRSTLVPSVACQTTEGEYLLLTIPTTY